MAETSAIKAAEGGNSDIERDYKALRAEVAKLSERLVAISGDDHEPSLQDRARAGARKARRRVEAEYDVLHGRASDAIEKVDEMVHEKPLAAIGIAAGVGLLVGLLVSRRR